MTDTILLHQADPTGPPKSSNSWGGFFKTVLGVSFGIVIGAVGGKVVKPLKEKSTSSL